MPHTILCPICRSSQSQWLENWETYKIFQCTACGLTYCDPMKAADSHFYEVHETYEEKWEFRELKRWTVRQNLNGNLLDIACGDGKLLTALKERFQGTGIDFNVQALEKVKRAGFEAYPLSLEEFHRKFSEKKFDLVTAFHVLEHVEDPNLFLRQIKNFLTQESHLVIGVPNHNRLAARFFRENWDYPPHHLSRWPQETLIHFLEKHGLEVLCQKGEPMTRWSQAASLWKDWVWSLVYRRIHFGIAAKLQTAGSSSNPIKSFLRSFLIKLKGCLIQVLVFLLTLITYPFLALSRSEGKTFLVMARLK